MIISFPRALGVGLAALLLGAAPQSISHAQTAFGAYTEQPSAALARHLRTLVANPRNLDALRGAGRAALEVGDLDAAVGFFARAEEVAPRDGRTKAGLGSVFTMLRQPSAALRYFQDAVALGVPAVEVARDRGLAYDLRGNTRAAQADYKLVLASRPDPEVTRRLALSQAIAGDGKAALATLDPQVRAKNPAAWRVRAFVLAIGGDAAGATRAAQAVMPAAQASGFAPYFRRMASLKAREKAAAAHFGSFPGDPGAIRMADLMSEGERAARVALENVGRTPLPETEAGRPDGSQGALGRAEGQVPASTAGTRTTLGARSAPAQVTPRNPVATSSARPRLGDVIRIVGTRVDSPIAAATQNAAPQIGAVVPAPVPTLNVTSAPAPAASEPSPASTVTSRLAPTAGILTAMPTSVQLDTSNSETSATVQGSPVPTGLSPSTAGATSPTEIAIGGVAAPLASTTAPSSSAATTTEAIPITTGATPASGIAALGPPPPSQPKLEPAFGSAASAPPPSQPKTERLAQASPPASRPKVERAVQAAPARDAGASAAGRHYAQVGIGQDVGALMGDWRRLRAKAGPVLVDGQAWTARMGRTNRLLVGPFASPGEAQAFVNKLTAAKVDAFVFSADAAEKVIAVGR